MTACSATFEAGSNGSNVTTGAGEASATAWDSVLVGGTGGAITYSNAFPFAGSLSALVKSPSSGGAQAELMRWSAALTGSSLTSDYGRLYFRPHVTNVTCMIVRYLSTNTHSCSIIMNSSGKLDIDDSTATVRATTTNSYEADKYCKIEWHLVCDTSAGALTLRFWKNADISNTAPTEEISFTGRNTLANINRVHFGHLTATTGTLNAGTYMDNILAGQSDWPTPQSTTTPKTISVTEALTVAVPRRINKIIAV